MPNLSFITGSRAVSMPPERLVLLLAMICCPPAVAAAPTQTSDNETRPREPEASIELLEFLGSWETATGPWNETMPDADAAQPTRRPKETTRD